MIAVAAYLAAIVVANLSVAALGPGVVIFNAFWLIGLDLTLRDQLHDRWQADAFLINRRWRMPLRMAILIAAGGALSWLLNAAAGQIAVASTVAFAASATLDAIAYHYLERYRRLVRVNGSNIVGAAADSLLFPTLAFGSFLPIVVLGQFAAKVAGGFVWSLILHALSVRRRPA